MSLGVAVLQGAEFSGSLMTARLGVAPGREVDGVPGPVTAELSFAPLRPIQQGAKWARAREDVIAQVRAGLFRCRRLQGRSGRPCLPTCSRLSEQRVFVLFSVDELAAGERAR